MNDSKELFDYWHRQVQLKNLGIVSAPEHVETQRLRHECTNYDDLRTSRDVRQLDELERSRVIAVIKYECTAQVLQRRAGILKDRVAKLQTATDDLEQEQTRFKKIIQALQAIIFGKDQDINTLHTRISILEAENETLRTESESNKAYAELLQAFEKLKKEFEKVATRRRELATNNQRLGGQVAHAKRFRHERDAARVEVQELRQQLIQAEKDNQRLRKENETLRVELSQHSQHSKLDTVEIRRDGHQRTKS